MTWISVKDRLPEDRVRVLVYEPPNHQLVAWNDGGVFQTNVTEFDMGVDLSGVTHWRPLPEPPLAPSEWIETDEALPTPGDFIDVRDPYYSVFDRTWLSENRLRNRKGELMWHAPTGHQLVCVGPGCMYGFPHPRLKLTPVPPGRLHLHDGSSVAWNLQPGTQWRRRR